MAPSTTPDPNPSPSTAATTESTALCQAPRAPIAAPRGESITAAIELGCEAGAVAVAGGSVWVVPHLDRVALRIDPATNTVIDRLSLGDRGPGAEVDGTDDMVWASVSSASYDYDRLVRIDPATGSIVARVEAAAGFPVIGDRFVWATGPRGVYRIDPTTNTVAAVVEAGDCRVVVLDDRTFCVGPGGAVSIDPTTDTVAPVLVAPAGWAVVAVDNLIWGIDDDSLWAFDPETGQIVADLRPPAGSASWSPDAVVVEDELWTTASSTANGPSDRLVRIDRRKAMIDCVVETPTSEFGIAAGFGSIWMPALRQPWLLRIDPAC